MAELSDDLVDIEKRLLAAMRQEAFAGYDPFDFLNAPLADTWGFENRLVRLAWLQFGKRLPINIRGLLRLPKRRNPKGLGLFILGMLEDYRRTQDEYRLAEAKELADWLLSHRSDHSEWSYPCWGYHFDWQARAFYVPKGKPNVITTCYVARALYALGKALASDEYLETALLSAKFIQHHLWTQADGRTFFAYIPGEEAFVHNASLWGAAWVAFVGTELGDSAMQDMAVEVAGQSVNEQRQDGAWVYGARYHHQFIDGFHTGYNLEALDLLRKSLGIAMFDESIERGMAYYRDNFFQQDGIAKYYHNCVYPLDMHNFAQGVLTLLKVGSSAQDVELAEKIMRRAVEAMYLPKRSRFIYQKHRWYTNKVDYIRWTQAWAYLGLAFFNRFMAECDNEKD